MIKKIEPILTVVIFILAVAVAKAGITATGSSGAKVAEKETVIVIDAGHGGSDPGKVGVNGTQEKELNLVYAELLEKWLTKKKVKVVMTRTTDDGLYSSKASNKKLEDMRKRCSIIDKAKADAVVSIHQNSFSDASVHGAQVFYFGHSAEGEKLAKCIQDSFTQAIGDEASRDIKANESYYILKKTSAPTVIVECGFLSNAAEEAMLNTKEYQETMIEAIGQGVLNYLKGEEQETEIEKEDAEKSGEVATFPYNVL